MTCKEAVYSNEIYDYITDFSVDESWQRLKTLHCLANIEDRYSILYFHKNAIPNREANFFEYQSVPKLYGLMQEDFGALPKQTGGQKEPFDPTGLLASGILQIQRPPLHLTGKGVVTCLIDTGIDYTNPVFLDENGDSRILAIWDQTIVDGTPPKGFVYGAEYTREQIREALRAKDPFLVVPSRDENGHGTAMASVMAGRESKAAETGKGRGSVPDGFVGAAPDADIVVVKLKEAKAYLKNFYCIPQEVPAYQENDIMLAVQYCDSFVRLFNRPIVLCLGLGSSMGDHAGSSALARYLGMVAIRRNRAVVLCGGNEGNAAHHYEGNLRTEAADRSGQVPENTYQDVEVRVEEGNEGFFLELWGNLPDLLNVSVRSPGGETIPPVRIGVRESVTYGFVYEKTRITIDSAIVEPASGEELMVFRVLSPTPGIWTFRVAAVGEVYNGVFHMWLPIRQFLNKPAYFLRPTPYVTLTEPAMAQNPIAVTAYDPAGNSFSISSGRGFNRVGTVRPDLCAPGVNVSTALGKRSGSSFGAAITAGAIAQFLQWAVVEGNQQFAESLEIQSFLIRGAVRDRTLSYPNREWGYGRLHMEGTFERLRGV